FDIADGDLVVEKRTPGAFFPGGCELPGLLRERDVDTVLVTGTVANVCCESTVREAAASGFRTVMVADANAALTDADLNATLRTVYRSFGDVRTVIELVAILGTAVKTKMIG
ncbi:MAG: cysteine hydrolase, partial [Acidimicrobiia bacterium]|nr:cysteine hydrolase [Acidimicrobiia bacterium]